MQKHKLVEKEQGGQTKEWPTAETETQVLHETWKKQLDNFSSSRCLEQNFSAYFEKYNKLYLIGKFSVKAYCHPIEGAGVQRTRKRLMSDSVIN